MRVVEIDIRPKECPGGVTTGSETSVSRSEPEVETDRNLL